MPKVEQAVKKKKKEKEKKKKMKTIINEGNVVNQVKTSILEEICGQAIIILFTYFLDN